MSSLTGTAALGERDVAARQRSTTGHLGWLGVVRLGLVQASLGSVVVLATSTMNRVMVVELALPAVVPGALIALHYFVQMLRPRLGHGSDRGGRRTPWILGGMALLSAGAVAAAACIVLMAREPAAGCALAAVAFAMIGLGVGSSGTSLLVLLAQRVSPARRPMAAAAVWLMMIAGLAVTATVAGLLLEPYSPGRLLTVTSAVGVIALILTAVATWNVEPRAPARPPVRPPAPGSAGANFRAALSEVWAEPTARRFTVFVFVSMLAYSSQDLVLEPFAGAVFGYSPGATTRLSGVLHGGVLAGMLIFAVVGTLSGRAGAAVLRRWTAGGCAASSLALLGLIAAAVAGPSWPLRPTVFLLGVANGAFAVAAISSMMTLAGAGRAGREGVRMGLWGGAQAVAFGAGGVLAPALSDLAHHIIAAGGSAYAFVFAGQAALFLAAAWLAARAPR